jgi:hypothetical protein
MKNVAMVAYSFHENDVVSGYGATMRVIYEKCETESMDIDL